MKKNRIFKSMISILLVLCMMFSMITVATTSTSAFLGTYALTKVCDKLVELGVRAACTATLEMSELLNEDQQETVESICSILLMDAAEKAIAEVQEMCEEILDELYEIEKKLTDYTNDLGSSAQDDKVSTAKKNYTDEWARSFYDVLDSKNDYMDNAYTNYVKYLVVSSLNQKGGYPTDQAEIDKLQNFAEEYKFAISASDVTDAGVAKAKSDLVTSFYQMNSSTSFNEADTYGNTKVNAAFVDTINALIDELKGNENDPNLLSYAATFAYYALPYEHQQYEFVYGVAKSHIMKIILLEMAYNEYLACQGEYLYNEHGGNKDDWADQTILSDGSSYNSLKTAMIGTEKADGLLSEVAEACGDYLDSTIYINTTSETGSMQNIKTHLGEYIKPEDAVPVNLTINGYESEHNYSKELAEHNQTGGGLSTIDSTEITKQNQITSKTLKFNRVVPGNESGEVYYILDPAQFTSPLEIKNIVHRIKRDGMFIDAFGGDIYIASCDYLNLKKNMSDGTNTYVCPNDLNNDLKNLFNTSAFKAYYQYDTDYYLSDFGYINPSSKLYAISSNYTMSYKGGASVVKSGDLYMQNLNTSSDVSLNLDVNKYDLEDDLYGRDDNYTVILKNTSSDYLQSASVKKNDVADSVQDIKVVNNDSEIGLNSSGKIKSGEKITIKFKVEDNTFASLKCIRNNATQTETVLIDGEDELQCFDKDENGYYEFEYYMPYSNVTFVIETKEPTMPQDENGSFIISSYSDLCAMSKNVNSGKTEYVNGKYIVVNDIDCSGNTWDTPIGILESPFSGEFDGQGYTIQNLQINDASGLFGNAVGAGIINLNLNLSEDSGLTASYSCFGAICGSLIGGIISNCSATGKINVYACRYIGGIVGEADASTIEKCMSDVHLYGERITAIGGVCSKMSATNITDCAFVNEIGGCNTTMVGGIVGEADSGLIENSYNYGSITCDVEGQNIYDISGNTNDEPYPYEEIDNCYFIDSFDTLYAQGIPMPKEQFKSGEVAYLLNREVTDGTQAWYQNLDNGLTPDDYPVLVNNDKNTVYKVDIKDKTYSNFTREELDPSLLKQEDLRTYQRIIENGKLSTTSKIAMGYGKVDNENSVITVYMADTAERMGVLMNQGIDGKKGVLELMGDYPKYQETSGELLNDPNFDEPDIYTDGNGCIFIAQPKDGATIPELTVKYTAKPIDDNESVFYTLKVEIIDTALFTSGKFAGGTILGTLSEDDPDYNVIKSEYENFDGKKPSEDKKSTTDEATKNTGTNNGTVKTGATSSAVILLFVMLSFTVGAFIYRRKENKE